MGHDPKDFGLHSIWKGAAACCCSGTTNGPSLAAVCFRAGWSLGTVKDTCLCWEAAGDMFCGRTVAGLDINSHEFAVSPPLITTTSRPKDTGESATEAPGVELVEEEGCTEADIDEAIAHLFPKSPLRWMLLMRHLVACLLYHRHWLRSRMDNNNPFMSNVLFRHNIFDAVLKNVDIHCPCLVEL